MRLLCNKKGLDEEIFRILNRWELTEEDNADPFAEFEETSKRIREVSVGVFKMIVRKSDVREQEEDVDRGHENDFVSV